ncbi:MAG: hypothetical protein NT075_15250 [Chloroflexi bacterium]|nr:hypothetical protein [Chloroflexota bacterium]
MYRLSMRILLVPFLASALLFLLWLVCAKTPPIALAASNVPTAGHIEQAEQHEETALAALVLTKTVGTNPTICAPTKVITVAAGTPLYYCYTVQNVGTITFTTHTITDSQYEGTLTNHVPYILKPGPPPDSIAVLIVSSTTGVRQTTVSTGTWIASSWSPTTTNGLTATASDTTMVLVPSLRVTETVGLDPHQCATTNQLNTPVGTQVTYCYTAYNDGQIPLRVHQVMDSQGGVIRDGVSLRLDPGATAHFTSTAPVTQTTTNVFTWTGYITNVSGISAVAVATATVHTPAIKLQATVGTDLDTCATTTAITVTAGTVVAYCYSVYNDGGVLFSRHEITDNTSMTHYSRTQPLAPGQRYAIVIATPITETRENMGNWSAYSDNTATGNPPLVAHDSSPVTVTVVYTLNAFVFYDVDGSGHLDHLERGWPNVLLNLKQTSGSTLTATTDLHGNAVFSGVHVGPYTLNVDMRSLPDGFKVTTGNVPYTQTMQWNQSFVSLGYTASPTFNSDCDPLSDQLEGAGDSDGNGIPDYLDGNCAYLPFVRR